MTKYKSICFLLIIIALTACTTDRPNNGALDRKMTGLLEAKDYFRLETALNNSGSQLSEAKELYYRAFVQNAFNRTEQSLQTIDRLFSKHKKSLNDSLIANLLLVKYDSHIKQFEYQQGAEALHTMLASYSHAMDSAKLEEYKRDYPVFEMLKNAPPQKICHTTDVTVPIRKNEFNHLTMQVICNGVREDFIFDTGANLSTIVESVAERMGIKPLEGSVQIGTSTGNYVAMKIGVADSLRISGLLFENVVFLIVPDENLSFPDFNYYIRGVIGFPLMYQMKEIRIDHRTGNIVVPQTPVKQNLHNLFLDGLEPVVQLVSGQDTLLFMMDTGAVTSEFSKKYFDEHRERIVETSNHITRKRGGAGGIIETEIYELTEAPFKIGNFQMTLPKISVETLEYSSTECFDGNLGQDVLMYFDEMILNFESMYLTFGDKKE